MNYYITMPLIALIINAFIGTYIFAQRHQKKIKSCYLMYVLVLEAWLILEIVLWAVVDFEYTILFLRLQSICWSMSALIFLKFTYNILGKARSTTMKLLDRAHILIIILCLFSNQVVNGYEEFNWGVAEIPGNLYIFIVVYTSFIYLHAFKGLWMQIKFSKKSDEKKQLKLLLFGTLSTLFCAILFDVLLPEMFEIMWIPRISSSITAVQCYFVFVAIKKYRFMTINVEDVCLNIFDHIHEGIILLDKDKKILDINSIGRNMLGICGLDNEDISLHSIIPDYEYEREYLNQEMSVKTCEGKELTVIFNQIKMPNEFRNMGKIIVLYDITDIIDAKQEAAIYQKKAYTDLLTGVYNHGYFHEYIKTEAEKADNTLTFLFCDLDKFKNINDTCGHAIGDIILSDTAKILSASIREEDSVFRYGGEEFLVVLKNISNDGAYKIAERIRKDISNSKSLRTSAMNLPVTVSTGIAHYPLHGENVNEVVIKADKAMYYSKQNGRNQTNVYHSGLE